MTVRKTKPLSSLGYIFKSKRDALSLVPNTRENFINNREKTHLIEVGSISVKTLTNIENGKNIPTLRTLKILSSALEVDILDLVAEILPLIPTKKNNL